MMKWIEAEYNGGLLVVTAFERDGPPDCGDRQESVCLTRLAAVRSRARSYILA
jgi:hypothetical protein